MNANSLYSDQKGSKIAILHALRQYRSVSRIGLSKRIGLTRAAVSAAIAELLEAGLVRETELLESTGGRPATALELVPGSHAVLGADYSNREWTLAAFDLLGRELHRIEIPVDGATPEAAVGRLAEQIKRLVRDKGLDPLPFLGLGMPGLVDTETGTIQSAADLSWQQVRIGERMSRELEWKTAVLNRHRARGLAEYRFGAGREYADMIYVGIGTGIAAGFFRDRRFLAESPGELGHMTMEPDGPLCPCGNRGCLQLLSAGPAIEREFRQRLLAGGHSSRTPDRRDDPLLWSAEHICAAADKEDHEAAVEAVDKAARCFGIALAALVNLFDPQGIVLGGPIPLAGRRYADTAVKEMRRRAMHPLGAGIEVKPAALREIGGALGAANFALDRHLTVDVLIRHPHRPMPAGTFAPNNGSAPASLAHPHPHPQSLAGSRNAIDPPKSPRNSRV